MPKGCRPILRNILSKLIEDAIIVNNFEKWQKLADIVIDNGFGGKFSSFDYDNTTTTTTPILITAENRPQFIPNGDLYDLIAARAQEYVIEEFLQGECRLEYIDLDDDENEKNDVHVFILSSRR